MTCSFESFLTVFRSYQDDKRVIMKGCVKGSLVYARKYFCYKGLEPDTAISTGQCSTSDLPGLLKQSRKPCILDNPDRCVI